LDFFKRLEGFSFWDNVMSRKKKKTVMFDKKRPMAGKTGIFSNSGYSQGFLIRKFLDKS